MGDYDICLKVLSRILPDDVTALAFPEMGLQGCQYLADARLPVSEAAVDYLYRGWVQGEECLVHLEFQADYDRHMPRRMFRYGGRIDENYGLPVIPAVVYLRRSSPRLENPEEAYEIRVGGSVINRYCYRVVKLWEMDYHGLALGREAPGLAPLIPLMRHQEQPEEAFRLSLKVLEGIGDQATRNELYGLTYLLSGLIYPKELLKGLFKKEILMESVTYQEAVQEGVEKGKREDLERILEARFGPLPTGIREKIRAASLVERLDELILKAATVSSLEEFSRQIE